MRPHRLARLPAHALPGGLRVLETSSLASRLLGLALLDELEADTALLLRRCRSVHTLGMMFPIDVVFLDRRGDSLRSARGVPPARLVTCRGAHAVLETPAGGADRFLAAGAGSLAAEPQPAPTSRRSRKLSADSASSSVTFSSSD